MYIRNLLRGQAAPAQCKDVTFNKVRVNAVVAACCFNKVRVNAVVDVLLF